MRDLLQSTMGGSIRIETELAARTCGRRWSIRRSSSSPCSISRSTRATPCAVGGTLAVATANVTLGTPRAPEEPPAGEYVAICVSDTGTGMSAEVRAKVVRAVLHHQGNRQGLGPRPEPGARLRQAVRRRRAHRIRESGRAPSVHIYLPRATARAGSEPRPRRGASGAGAPQGADDPAGR